jgi:hypothetical protein
MTDEEREGLGRIIADLERQTSEQAAIIERVRAGNVELKRKIELLNGLVSGTLFLPTRKLRPIYAD